ncbi:MAG: hypothetical protein AAF483_12045 [Planctomycetota bacterium]
MKNPSILVLTMVFIQIFASDGHAEVIDRFDFNEAAGTSFSGWTNSGTNGANWANFTGSDSNSHATDGAGILAIDGGLNLNRYINHNTNALNSGIAEFSFRIDSMDMSDTAAAAAAGTEHLFGFSGFALRSGGSPIHQFRITLTGDRIAPELRLQARNNSSGQVDTLHDFNASSFTGGLTTRVSINFDEAVDNMQVYYQLGSSSEVLGLVGTYGASSIDQLQYISQQTSGDQGDLMLGNDFVRVDYVQFLAVPEPSCLLTTMIGLSLCGWRRRSR